MGRKRNREFGEKVLANFRYKCAICGFDANLNKFSFGLDGAHIRWFSQFGPDTVENGLSLCKLHHWAFDRGAISVDANNNKIIVSSNFIGKDDISIQYIEKYDGKEILPYKDVEPSTIYLNWHNKYIFLG